ncbi:MAG TPA: hypothetical protein VFK37_05915 [Bacillales bacterium]|nr:hypothetical protein [Bacillales bacterium]
MEVIVALAAVFLVAILRASWIKRHGGFLGMKKPEPKLRKEKD